MLSAFAGVRVWLVAVLVAVCTVPGTAVAQAGGKKEIVIGYSISMTGRFSTSALEVHRGYELWAEEVNKQGGIAVKDLGRKLPVKLLHYDDSSDTSNAIRNYERLITRDQVDLLLSPWGSGHNFAISAVTEKHKYPVPLATAAADAIFQRGFKYIFETTQLASNMYNGLADYLVTMKGQIKTVAIAYENFLFTQSLRTAFLARLKGTGIEVVADEQYPLGGQDFTSLLLKVKAAKPDAFLAINIMPSVVYLTRQMAETGFKPKFYAVTMGPMYEEAFVQKLGGITDGIVENGFWHPDLPFPGARKFYDEYSAKFKTAPATDAAYAFIGAQVLQQGVEQAGTLNREKIAGTLHSGKFTTILGPYEYDENGVNKHQLSFLAQLQNGKRVLVWPKEVANAALKFPY